MLRTPPVDPGGLNSGSGAGGGKSKAPKPAQKDLASRESEERESIEEVEEVEETEEQTEENSPKESKGQKKRKKLEEKIRQQIAKEVTESVSRPIYIATGALGAILPFKGEETENPKQWWETYDYVTNANGWTKSMKCAQLPIYLQETALTWYKTLNPEIRMDFERVGEDFLANFYDRTNASERYKQLCQRIQLPNESVKEYALQKKLLCQKYDPRMSQKDMAINLVAGLRDEIRLDIQYRAFNTWEEAIKAAEKREMKLKKPEFVKKIDTEEMSTRVEERLQELKELVEDRVREIRELPNKRAGLRASDGRPICHRCERVGHVARVCPEKPHPVRYGPSRTQRTDWRSHPYSSPQDSRFRNPPDRRFPTSKNTHYRNDWSEGKQYHQENQRNRVGEPDRRQDPKPVNPSNGNWARKTLSRT